MMVVTWDPSVTTCFAESVLPILDASEDPGALPAIQCGTSIMRRQPIRIASDLKRAD
jgi:hypothetical protein